MLCVINKVIMSDERIQRMQRIQRIENSIERIKGEILTLKSKQCHTRNEYISTMCDIESKTQQIEEYTNWILKQNKNQCSNPEPISIPGPTPSPRVNITEKGKERLKKSIERKKAELLKLEEMKNNNSSGVHYIDLMYQMNHIEKDIAEIMNRMR